MTRLCALLVALALVVPLPAAAQQALTFVGSVTNVKGDGHEFAVRGKTGTSSATHTFFVDKDFAGVSTSKTGKTKSLAALKVGTQVQVTYRKGLLGRNYALKVVIVNGFAIPMAQPTTH